MCEDPLKLLDLALKVFDEMALLLERLGALSLLPVQVLRVLRLCELELLLEPLTDLPDPGLSLGFTLLL